MSLETKENSPLLPPLRDVIVKHGLGAKKTLGQHFLLDLNVTRRIVKESGLKQEELAIEIGPGPGGLTRALLENGCPVIAIERDDRCMTALTELADAYPAGRLTLIQGDALQTDLASIDEDRNHLQEKRIIANLPYNIGTNLLLQWLNALALARQDNKPLPFSGMALMFQREVAERLVAKPGSKAYGRLSVAGQWVCQTRIAFHLPAAAFTPPPKVASSVLLLTPHQEAPAPAHWQTLQDITAAAFNQRRKMLRQSLKSYTASWGVSVRALLDLARISEDRRADSLSISEFCALSQSLRTLTQK